LQSQAIGKWFTPFISFQYPRGHTPPLGIILTMEKKEFEYRKKLIEFEREKNKEVHEFHMIELEKQFELQKLKHEQSKEEQRIKSAEIRKNMERKENMGFMRSYGK